MTKASDANEGLDLGELEPAHLPALLISQFEVYA